MKILYSWLKEFLPLELPPQELAQRLLLLGLEVEELAQTGPAFSGVVVGEVLKVEAHPNADRLRLCQVTDGAATFSVVCGAPNVAQGQRVPFARLGARLPGGLKIEKAKIRGVESQGMICSASELGLENGKSPGIKVLDAGFPLGRDFAQTLGGPDAVLDVSVTPNRPDCLSHLGLARELSIHLRLPLKYEPGDEVPAASPDAVPVEVLDKEACPRYLGRAFAGLQVGPSPSWLAQRLEGVGLRPINNLVDVTNYVLMETGQPLHVFDLDRLQGPRIVVRRAREGERIKALDGREHALSPDNLVIADASRPLAVAGVIGGEESGVTERTTRAFLEVAHFAPAVARRSARRLGVRTDSSYRFERGTDPAAPAWVARRAARLILELCGGQAGKASDTLPISAPRQPIEVSAAQVNAVLGSGFAGEQVEGVLKRLAARSEAKGGALLVEPPSWRRDLETPWDLAEEVARHLGYDDIPYARPKVSLPAPQAQPQAQGAELCREVLSGLGFYEAYNYDFVSAAELERYYNSAPEISRYVRPHNPLSQDWAFLRPTLAIGLLRSAERNFNQGAEGVRLFEIGKIYLPKQDREVLELPFVAGIMAGFWPSRPSWKGGRRGPDLFDAKAALEALCRPASLRWEKAQDPLYHPNAYLRASLDNGALVGYAGLLHPETLRRWNLRCASAAVFQVQVDSLPQREAARFKPYSPYPSVSRDLSILVGEERLYGEIAAAARGAAGPDLRTLELVDVFTGPGVPQGKKSLTLRLTFSRLDRTLRDEEVVAAVDKAVKALQGLGASLR